LPLFFLSLPSSAASLGPSCDAPLWTLPPPPCVCRTANPSSKPSSPSIQIERPNLNPPPIPLTLKRPIHPRSVFPCHKSFNFRSHMDPDLFPFSVRYCTSLQASHFISFPILEQKSAIVQFERLLCVLAGLFRPFATPDFPFITNPFIPPVTGVPLPC